MIKQNIKFLTTGQFLTFSHTCKNLSSDVRIQDLENHNRVDINGKDLSELARSSLVFRFSSLFMEKMKKWPEEC